MTSHVRRKLRRAAYDLEKAKIAYVILTYDGRNPPGDIVSITFLDRQGAPVSDDLLPKKTYYLLGHDVSVRTIMEYIGHWLLPSGWADSPGSTGTLTVDLKARVVHHEHHQRHLVTEVHEEDIGF